VRKKKVTAIAIPQITTIDEAEAHQRKHGFPSLLTARERQLNQVHGELDLRKFVANGQNAQRAADAAIDFEKRGNKPKKLRASAPVKKTLPEREMTATLERRKALGEIKDFVFQGIALLWGGSMRYKADFAVRENDDSITLIEVKGYMIRDRDIVRFKGCRNEWKWAFKFEFHQREKGGQWNQLL
jgi:hypothetical protein